MFSLRIFSVDHYMSSPILGLDSTYSHFRGKEVKQVPVLRIFGANQTGHKTCLHVHGVLPYLHIPHDETSLVATEKLCYRVATSLDKAINISMGQSDSTTQHVFDVTPVAGVPLYGYHNRKHQFLKIRFFNPFTVKKAATLFQNGTILDRIYQPHDAHINYELQFMIDFNLHGMNNIYLSDVKYRIDENSDLSIIDDIPSQHILNKNIKRISTCKYEIDCGCENILNLQEVTNGKLNANPGIAAIWEEERHRRQLQNKDTQNIAPTASQFRTKLTETTSEIFFKNRLRDRLETIKNSNVSSVSSLNQSIYPSEVSEQSQFLNASIAHLIQNPELSVTSVEKSEPVVNESIILSLTQEDKNQPIIDDIYNALIDLIDEDSILSQHPLNENAVVLEDEIEQESHDLEQTLIEDNEMLSSNNKKSESMELESDMINEIFSSNDSFMKHLNVSQLEQNVETDLEQTVLNNYSEDTLIESEKQYSIFYDDIIEMKKTQLKSTEITFSQFSDDILNSVIEDEIAKIEKSYDEESIIYSSDSDEIPFDGKWRRIPQIDGATEDTTEKPKRKYKRTKKNQPREILCERTGIIYTDDSVEQPESSRQKTEGQKLRTTKEHKKPRGKVLKVENSNLKDEDITKTIKPESPGKIIEGQKLRTTKEHKKPSVKVLKVENSNVKVEDITKTISYMPVSLQDAKPNETFSLSMPIIDDTIDNLLSRSDCETIPEHYDELLKDFDHFLTENQIVNSTFEMKTTYNELKTEKIEDSFTMPPVDVIIKQELDSTYTIKNEPVDYLDLNFDSYIEPLNVDIKNTQMKKTEPSIKNETILQQFVDDNNFLNSTFNIYPSCSTIKGLISEMINAIVPDETYEIYPESSCNLYHEMNAKFSGKTTMIDINCKFLQNVRERKYRRILNPMEPLNTPFIVNLNRNLEPITINAYYENQLSKTKMSIIDKDKFVKSVIYDNNLEITDKHTVFCKNGKIVIKENLSGENKSQNFRSQSCFELYNWERVKFNIKEGRPWKSTKDTPRKQVRRVNSLPAIVTSKPFDAKLRDFITNNNTFNVQNKSNEKISSIEKPEKLLKSKILKPDVNKIDSNATQKSLNSNMVEAKCVEKNKDQSSTKRMKLKSIENFKKTKCGGIENIKKETKLENLKCNSKLKIKEINLEFKNNFKTDDKIENPLNSENIIVMKKIDSVLDKPKGDLKNTENEVKEKKLKLDKYLKINDETFEKVESESIPKYSLKKFESEHKIKKKDTKISIDNEKSKNIICKIPLKLISHKVCENLKIDTEDHQSLEDNQNITLNLLQPTSQNSSDVITENRNEKIENNNESKKSDKPNTATSLEIQNNELLIDTIKQDPSISTIVGERSFDKNSQLLLKKNIKLIKPKWSKSNKKLHSKKLKQNRLIFRRQIRQFQVMNKKLKLSLQQKIRKHFLMESNSKNTLIKEMNDFKTFISHRTIKKNKNNKFIISVNNNDSNYTNQQISNASRKTLTERWNDSIFNGLLDIDHFNSSNQKTKSSNSKSEKNFNGDEENLVKSNAINSPNKRENKFNVTNSMTNEKNTISVFTKKSRKTFKKVSSNSYKMNLQQEAETISEVKIQENELNLKQNLSENFTLSNVDSLSKSLEKVEESLDNQQTQLNIEVLQPSIKKKASKKSSLASKINLDNVKSVFENLENQINNEDDKDTFDTQKILKPNKNIKSVDLNPTQHISENNESHFIISNQLMNKNQSLFKNPKKRYVRKSTMENLIDDNDYLMISENESRSLRPRQRSKIVKTFTPIKENEMAKHEEYMLNSKENVSLNNGSSNVQSHIDCILDDPKLSSKESSILYEKELSHITKASTSQCKTLKSCLYTKSVQFNPQEKSVKFNIRKNISENNENSSVISHTTKPLKDLKVFVESLEISKNSEDQLELSETKKTDSIEYTEEESNKGLKIKRRKRKEYTRRRRNIKTVKTNLNQNLSDNEPKDKIGNENESSQTHSLLNSQKKIIDLKMENESVLNKKVTPLENPTQPRTIRRAKLNAYNKISNATNPRGIDNKRNKNLITNPQDSLTNYQKIPGIDGTLDILFTSLEYSSDSSTDDNGLLMAEDIIFVDGLNDKKSIREKYNLRECSVKLTSIDSKDKLKNINKRKVQGSQTKKTISPKVSPTNKKCKYTPLDVVFGSSPTSRKLNENERDMKIKNARKRRKLNFDDQLSLSNENTEELQNMEQYCKENNIQSEETSQSPGESNQDYQPQFLESLEKEKSLKLDRKKEIKLKKNENINLRKNNKNDKNNVIKNACDNNSSDLVNNLISDKNRRSLRNRTLLSETKKNITKHSAIISKTSTPNRKIASKTSTNRTYVEENTGCVFSPKSAKKISLINLSQVPLQNNIDAPTEQIRNSSPEIESDDSITIPNPAEIIREYISPSLEHENSITVPNLTEINRDYISPSPEHEVQLLISPRKTKDDYTNALEYDIKNKFFPQPGCSKAKENILSSESHSEEKTKNLYQHERSQSLQSENHEKLTETQVSDCDVESFYDMTFGDCTKLDDDQESSNPKSNSSFHCAQNIAEFGQKQSQSTEMQLSGLSFQSDPILTQTPNEKLNVLNLSTIGFEKGSKRLTNGCVILMPKFNPPSYDDIKNSAVQYNIPEVQYENPFYSVPTDATGRIEIGHKILKVPTKCVKDLPEFVSNLEFDPLNVWRQRKIDNMHVQGVQNLASNREIVITPNIKPPSLKEIKVWLKAKNFLKEVKSKRDDNIKIKIRIPSSPGGGGGDNDSDDSDSLTLTPCTPRNESVQTPTTVNTSKTAPNSTIQTSTENFLNTPKTSQRQQSPSMIHKSTKRILKNKRVKVALAKSFQKSQVNESLLDPSVANLLNDSQFRNDLNSPLSNSSCLITGVTLNNTHGFKVPLENFQDVKTLVKHQYLTTVILELHIKNREDFKPNPRLDPIVAIFYSIYNDVPEDFDLPQNETGVICVGPNNFLIGTCTSDIKIIYVESEIQLFDKLIELFTKWDPDILAGYEISRLSWGYLLERSFHLQLNLPKRLSRIPESRANTRLDENGQMSDIHFTGRIFLEIWRLMRHEIDLYSYSFENIYFHILHERIPKHSFRNLSTWFESTRNRYITVQYYLKRVTGVLKILDQLDFIGRTSELARLFGIQFYEVLSRGSQFRVESMMLRLTKPLNYIPVTPSVTQRAKMKAPEFLPLIMEPDSRLYNDPIIVLDFQSLYPSMIIAYNYCFSTCLGRVSELGNPHPFEFGATQLRVNTKLVEAYLNNNKLNISPCGVAFVNDSVRQGILPRMLKEILDCRLMVKKSLKENKDDATLKRVLNSRQLGLKLIANVTYGYTAANFSGRMPCCELGDSVVSKGRETLERAIQMVEKNEKWRAKVVYGDTDSLFVMTPGRSRKDAFQIGKEIAEAVTNDNPTPVKLKLEKIYQPCILQTKKRYVGYMYESPEQEEPVYNAKGIETVRRDGCPAVAKILEKTLRILFETKDMSLVKQYVCRQFSKIITGRINLQDLIFAREFRGLNGYRPGAMVPALELAKRYKQHDPRSEPLRSERVPYVIASGAPGTTLVRLAKGPHELLSDPALKPHIQYYITKVIIPPLNRCLSLCGVDVHAWYKDLPRKYKLYFPTDETSKDAKKSTIAQHFATASCVSCGTQTRDVICTNCIQNPQKTVTVLEDKLRKWERNLDNIKRICSSCCGRFEEIQCISLDCPVLYRLTQAQRDCDQAPFVRRALLSKILINVQSSPSVNSDVLSIM